MAGDWRQAVSLSAALNLLISIMALAIMITLWGLVPALLFGAAGSWAAERWMSDRAWWVWGGAGALSAAAYVGAAIGLNHLWKPITIVVAPWLVRAQYGLEEGAPAPPVWDTAHTTASGAILGAGVLAGLLYFCLSRGRWTTNRADKPV